MITNWNREIYNSFNFSQMGFKGNWIANSYPKKESCSVNMLITATAGDKIKMQGRMIQGDFCITSAHGVRMRIKKI